MLPRALLEEEIEEDERLFPKWEFLGMPLVRKAGVITIFEKGAFFGSPKDAVIYANRARNKKKFGALMGFVFGEVVWGDPRINFMFFKDDEREKSRKRKITRNRHLKRRGIRVWQYEKYLQKNPLERYLAGKEPLREAVCSKCGKRIPRNRKGYRLKPTPLCQECNQLHS
jgi:hypothetical protein